MQKQLLCRSLDLFVFLRSSKRVLGFLERVLRSSEGSLAFLTAVCAVPRLDLPPFRRRYVQPVPCCRRFELVSVLQDVSRTLRLRRWQSVLSLFANTVGTVRTLEVSESSLSRGEDSPFNCDPQFESRHLSHPVAGFPALSPRRSECSARSRELRAPNWPAGLSHVTWESPLQRKTPLSCRSISTRQFRGSHFRGGRWSPPTAEHHVRDASPAALGRQLQADAFDPQRYSRHDIIQRVNIVGPAGATLRICVAN